MPTTYFIQMSKKKACNDDLFYLFNQVYAWSCCDIVKDIASRFYILHCDIYHSTLGYLIQ